MLRIVIFAAGSWLVYEARRTCGGGYRLAESLGDAADEQLPADPVDRVDRRRRRAGAAAPRHEDRWPSSHTGWQPAWRHLLRSRADPIGTLSAKTWVLLVYLLFVYRGMKIAAIADDGFSKLLAFGLTFAFGLQAFLIVGGVVRLIPLTGITLPFVSYGGSSIVSNFLMLGLLLMVSNRAMERHR